MADSAPITVHHAGWLPYVVSGKNNKVPVPSATVWAGGLVALFLLLVGTLVVLVPKVEARLAQQTNSALAEAGIDTSLLSFSWNYRNLGVSGELPPGVELDQLATALNAVSNSKSIWVADGIRNLRLDVVKPEISIKADLVIQRLNVRFFIDDKTATLSGIVQTHAQRDRLVSAALQAGIESINDNLDVLVGNRAMEGGDVKVDALAQMLEKSGPRQVVIGQANLTTRNLSYRLTAKDRDAAKAIEQAAAVTMVDFEVIGEMDYLKHGFVEVRVESSGSEMHLTGTVLSEAQRNRLRFAAAETVGADNVMDNLKISGEEAKLSGANERVAVLTEALSLFGPGSRVSMQLAGKELLVDAIVENESDRVALLDALYSVGESGMDDNGLTVREKIKVLNANKNSQVDVLQQQLDAYTQEIRKTVVFNTGEAKLSRRAKATLDQVASTINNHPGLRVEVEGHTDNVGRAKVNDDLSQKRANAVRDYLIAQSILANNLVAVGYGQRRPLESNDTIEGRRLNRRVHFKVLENSENE